MKSHTNLLRVRQTRITRNRPHGNARQCVEELDEDNTLLLLLHGRVQLSRQDGRRAPGLLFGVRDDARIAYQADEVTDVETRAKASVQSRIQREHVSEE